MLLRSASDRERDEVAAALAMAQATVRHRLGSSLPADPHVNAIQPFICPRSLRVASPTSAEIIGAMLLSRHIK